MRLKLKLSLLQRLDRCADHHGVSRDRFCDHRARTDYSIAADGKWGIMRAIDDHGTGAHVDVCPKVYPAGNVYTWCQGRVVAPNDIVAHRTIQVNLHGLPQGDVRGKDAASADHATLSDLNPTRALDAGMHKGAKSKTGLAAFSTTFGRACGIQRH